MASKRKKSKFETELAGNCVLVHSLDLANQLHQKGYGERKVRQLVLDLYETLYLVEHERIQVFKHDKPVTARFLRSFAEKSEKSFFKKFVVYSDFRDKGFVIRTGFKFGFDFRVYPRGKKPGEAHTQFVIDVKSQGERLSMPQLSRMVRLAQTLHTVCLQAVVDSENEINYYSIGRVIP